MRPNARNYRETSFSIALEACGDLVASWILDYDDPVKPSRVDGVLTFPSRNDSFMTRSVLRPLAAFGFVGVLALVVGAQSLTFD